MCAGDVFILEDLAVHTEEFLGFGEPLAVQGVSVDRVRPLIDRIAPGMGDPQAQWAWIYEQNGLKHGALHAIGYHVASSYLADAQSTPIAAMNVPWQDFWRAYFSHAN